MIHDGKGFEIYTVSLEFESELASLVRAWNKWGFTRSPEVTKYAFREVGFLEEKKN
jgi:hypothetical protein